MKYWRNGFKDSSIHGEPLASDIVLTDDEYRSLLAEQSLGKILTIDDGGLVAVLPVVSPENDRTKRQSERNSALQSMTHDFGDGRIMQTRPQDEANIIAAIDLLESEDISSVSWVMADNTKHDVTIDDLRTALRSGRLQGLAIWNEYNP